MSQKNDTTKEEALPMDLTWYDELEARIPTGTVRTRFAPSPTGYMHVGNLRTEIGRAHV